MEYFNNMLNMMTTKEETSTSFPSDRELIIENEKLKAKLDVALKQLEQYKAQYVTLQRSKHNLNDTKIYTSREMFVNGKRGDVIRGKSGSRLCIAIHKKTREVFKKVPDNWTEEGHTKFNELFPDGKAIRTIRRKKNK